MEWGGERTARTDCTGAVRGIPSVQKLRIQTSTNSVSLLGTRKVISYHLNIFQRGGKQFRHIPPLHSQGRGLIKTASESLWERTYRRKRFIALWESKRQGSELIRAKWDDLQYLQDLHSNSPEALWLCLSCFCCPAAERPTSGERGWSSIKEAGRWDLILSDKVCWS